MPVIPLPIESYTDTAPDNTNTRCINVYAIRSPQGAISPFYLESAAGLKPRFDIGTGPIRAHEIFEDNLYVATGTRIFKIKPDQTTTDWGAISNGGNMPMAVGFNFILAVGEAGSVFLIDDDGVTPVSTPFLVEDVEYFQGVFVFLRKDAPLPGEYFTSKITPDVGQKISFDVFDFANAETESDKAVAVVRKNDLLWIIGDRTVEVFGFGTGIPFPPVGGVFFDVGCVARNTVSKSVSNVYWLGSDNTIRENGQRVSTLAVERAIDQATDLNSSFSFSFKELGKEFVAFTFGLSATWVFDVTERIWHERKTYLRDEWQARTGIRFAGVQLIGDGLSGKLFELDVDTQDYDGSPRICTIQTPYVHAEGQSVRLGPLEIKINGGAGTIAVPDPQMIIEYSKDGGRTFSNEIFRDMGSRGIFRKPIKVNRLGRGEDVLIRLTVSDPVKFQLIQMWMGAKLGKRT